MAQNLDEAILRLGLEVIGADAIKAAADAVQRYGAATKSLQPARVDTIIGAIDLATPVYKKVATSIRELNNAVIENAAVIQRNLEAQRNYIRLYANELRNLGVPDSVVSRGLPPVRRQVLSAVTSATGLLPSDVAAIGLNDRLYRAGITAIRAIDQSGSRDPAAAAEGRINATRATRSVARLAPGVFGGSILENPNYQVIQRAAGVGQVSEIDLQAALAELGPLIAQQRLLEIYRAALRVTAGRGFGHLDRGTGQHPLFSIQRQGFDPLGELNPELTARLQGSIGLGLLGQAESRDLDQATLLLASRQRLISPGLGLPPRRLSPLQEAQLKRIQGYGFTAAEAPVRKLIQTEAGNWLDRMPVPTTLFRPRTGDVRELTAGSMLQEGLPRTAIETTARVVGPVSPGIAGIMSTAEAAILQGRGMVPERTALEKLQYAINQRIRQVLGRVIEPLENEMGFARIGATGASSFQQAIDLVEGHNRPTIFPKQFSKMLNISPEAGQLWIHRLQQEGYLGQAAGTGLAGGLPIIGAQARRSKQILEEGSLTEAVATERLRQARASTRQAAKEALEAESTALTVGGGGAGEPPDEGEVVAGSGGRRGRGKGPPPPKSQMGRFGGRFLGLGYYLGAASLLYPIMSSLMQADQAAKELQITVQRIQGIYGSHTLGEQFEIKQSIIAAAQKYGENLTEVATAAERFAQAQEPMQRIGADLQIAAAGSKAFGTNMQQISEFMIGIQEATGGKTTGAQAVNLVSAFSRQGVVSPMSLMTAMQQLTPITQELFAEPSGTITDPALIGSILKTVSQRTGMSGTTVTNAMRYMFARFKGETAGNIEELSGVNLGTLASHGQELKPVAEILRDLAAAYKNLIDTGRSAKATELLTLLFGPRQIGPGATFLEEMPKILRDAMTALSDTGATAERASLQMETLETAQKRLHNDLTTLWGASMIPIRTGMDNFIAKLIELGLAYDRLLIKVANPKRKWYEQGGELGQSGELTTDFLSGAVLQQVQQTQTPKILGPQIPMAYGNVPAFLAGSRNIIHEAPTGTTINENLAEGVGKTPSEAIYEKPPLRNRFAEAMVRGQISLQAQMRRAQIAVTTQQTQTAIRLSTMLRQAQGRSTIGLELQGIEAGRIEQGGINQATFTEQLKLYQADYARINKEITDAEKNKKYNRQQRDSVIIPLQEERLELNAKVALLFQANNQEQNILNIKTEQTKQNAIQIDQMRQQVEKLKELGQIGQIAQNFLVHGLQSVAQALDRSGGPGRGRRAAGAFAGAAATSVGEIMSRGLDLFGPQGAFPGVGRALYSKLGKPSEADITAQAKQIAPVIQSQFPGMSLEKATELAKDALLQKANKKQAYAEIGQIGGELAGSAIGGNNKGAQIGSTLGAAAGTLLPLGPVGPMIGGLLGGVIGGFFGHNKPPPVIGDLKIIAENTKEQVRLLENTNKLLEANFVSFNVPTGFRLPSYQPGFFGGIAASRGAGGGGVVNSSIHVAVNIGGTNVSADKLGSTIAQAISDRLELESRASGNYNPRLLYG